MLQLTKGYYDNTYNRIDLNGFTYNANTYNINKGNITCMFLSTVN